MNQVYHDNFLNNGLPAKSVKLILADPPYYGVKGSFDFVWKSFEDYLRDVELWAAECKRLLADNGTLYWYGDAKNIAYSQIILDRFFNLENNIAIEFNRQTKKNIDNLRIFAPVTERLLMYSNESYNLTSCVTGIRDYLRTGIETAKGSIVYKDINIALGVASNGGGLASACLSLNKDEPAMITEEKYLLLQSWCAPFLSRTYDDLRDEYETLRLEYEETRRYFNNFMRLTDVMKFDQESHITGQYDHDTVKPEKLSRNLILTSTRPGDLCFIPFAGSGTECAMCEKEGRPFIGFDIERKYVYMSNERIHKHRRTPQLF